VNIYQDGVFQGFLSYEDDVHSATITGLAPGVPHTFTVQAHNAFGVGTASAHTAPVVPRAAPSAPVIGTPTAGAASATVRWSPPVSDGGAAITRYTVRVYRGSTLVKVAYPAASATSLQVTGLANGSPHTFLVQAHNQFGAGPVSARSAAVTPLDRPSPPRIATPVPGNASAGVRWLPPVSNGGTAVTAYVVRTYRGSTLVKQTVVSGRVNGALVTGLTNGVRYTVNVIAVNAKGWGPASATLAVVPRR
jgi:hypothetical protein